MADDGVDDEGPKFVHALQFELEFGWKAVKLEAEAEADVEGAELGCNMEWFIILAL